MLLPDDEVVLLEEVSSVVVEEEEAALTAAAGAVVAAGATELEEEVGLGFCLAGQAAAEMAETATSMDWNFMVAEDVK